MRQQATARAPRGLFPGELFFNSPRDVKYRATGEYRAPRRGEFFLSGAVITAYRANTDIMTTPCWIAEPVKLVTCQHCSGSGKVEAGPCRIAKIDAEEVQT